MLWRKKPFITLNRSDDQAYFLDLTFIIDNSSRLSTFKGPVKLIKRMKIAHSFLQSVSDQFHILISSLPMQFYKWLSKNFSKPTFRNGEIGRCNRSLLKESFQLTLKCHQFIPSNMERTCLIFTHT